MAGLTTPSWKGLAGFGCALVVVGGCVVDHGATSSASSGFGDREFAQPARTVTTPTAASDATTVAGSASTDAGSAVSSSAAPVSSSGPSTFREIVHVDDAAGDAGLTAPGYADAVRIAVDDDGTSVRVTVQLRATVPTTLGNGEVEGVGVNVTPADGAQPGAQLFADGESDGWFGYLQVGDHFITYPGTLDLAGSTIVFTVPWSSVGDPRSGTIDAFVDWSKPTIGTAAQSSADRAPDSGTVAFSR